MEKNTQQLQTSFAAEEALKVHGAPWMCTGLPFLRQCSPESTSLILFHRLSL